MAYKICLSNKSEVQIDREELEMVINAISSGAKFIKVKSGIFNPAYLVCIEPDEKRLEGLKALDKLPDIFERIGKMASVDDVIKLRLESEKEEQISQEEIKEKLEKFKPDFLK